ncbi:hypothetical protein HDU81_002001, partial [Chytriomyces hyalinus]
MASLSEAVSTTLCLSGPPSPSGLLATSGSSALRNLLATSSLLVPSRFQAEDSTDRGPPKEQLVQPWPTFTYHSDVAPTSSAGHASMDAHPVATYIKVKTAQPSATTMVKSSRTPRQVPNSELIKLPAYADAGEFNFWLRQYLLIAEQKFGHGRELYLPMDKRGDTILFHPTSFKPIEPETTAEFEARYTFIAQVLEDKYKMQQGLVFKLATQQAISLLLVVLLPDLLL